jgi:hypothetical protein
MATIAGYARRTIGEVEAAAGVLPCRLAVELPGLSIRVRTFEGALADAIGTHLLPARRADEFLSARHADIFIAHGDLPRMPKPAPWAGPYMPYEVSKTLAAADLQACHFHDLDHWHLYDPRRNVGVQLMTSASAYPPWEIGAPLRPFLHWHYAERGMRLGHCGTLGFDGGGIMLAGGAGSGKSGTVIAGLLHGLQSVGDDYALLETEPDIFAYPLFPVLKQDPSGFERLGLGRFLDKNAPLNWQGKHQFRIQDISQSEVPGRLRIRALAIPRMTGGAGKTVITQASKSAAMIALAASSIHQMPGERESGFRFFGEVANRLPCFYVDLGGNPAEIADVLRTFIVRLSDED